MEVDFFIFTQFSSLLAPIVCNTLGKSVKSAGKWLDYGTKSLQVIND